MSLWQLRCEFNDIFALSNDEVCFAHIVQHHIDTGQTWPIRMRPHCLPIVQLEATDQEISAMLGAGIIEPSDSPWSSAVVIVSGFRVGRKSDTRVD